ncbi:hypothetical protein [Streptosporangium sp. NPDC004631]
MTTRRTASKKRTTVRRSAKRSEWASLAAAVVIVWAAALAVGRLGDMPAWAVLAAGTALGMLLTLTGRRLARALARRTGIRITRVRKP